MVVTPTPKDGRRLMALLPTERRPRKARRCEDAATQDADTEGGDQPGQALRAHRSRHHPCHRASPTAVWSKTTSCPRGIPILRGICWDGSPRDGSCTPRAALQDYRLGRRLGTRTQEADDPCAERVALDDAKDAHQEQRDRNRAERHRAEKASKSQADPRHPMKLTTGERHSKCPARATGLSLRAATRRGPTRRRRVSPPRSQTT